MHENNVFYSVILNRLNYLFQRIQQQVLWHFKNMQCIETSNAMNKITDHFQTVHKPISDKRELLNLLTQ